MNNYPLDTILQVMKPCKLKPDNVKHQAKLKQCLVSKDYCWEEKLDGINGMYIGGRSFTNVISKVTGLPTEKTEHTPIISEALSKWPLLILNGEYYIPGKKCNFVASMINNGTPEVSIAKQQKNGWVPYHIYDLLRDVDGTWMLDCPYEERRARLEQIYKELLEPACDLLVLNDSYDCATTKAEENFNAIIARGYEGIVLKRKDGLYQPGKRPMWNQIKMKASEDDDVVIMGFQPATRKYTGKNLESWPYWEGDIPVTAHWAKGLIGTIDIGKYSNGTLVKVGTVTGITEVIRERMTRVPEEFIGKVMVIKAMEVTENGAYRHANYLRMHADKRPEECIIED